MITQLVVLLLLLKPLDTSSSTPDDQLLPIASVTAKTVHQRNPPENAIDGNLNTIYHTEGGAEPPQWLKLQLEEPSLVSKVAIINR